MAVIDNLFVRLGWKYDPRGLKKFQNGIERVRGRLDGMRNALAVPGAALTAGLGIIGKNIYDFEKSMRVLQATSQATGKDFEAMRKQARELGATTEFSATDAANAQVLLAQAGFKTNQILKATPTILNLASAGQLSMAEASELAANQINAFGLDVSEVRRVADVMAEAARSANTTVKQLGPAFRQVAPLAAKLGLNIERTASMIAVLRNNGLKAEQAGTALRAIFSRLQKPTTDAANAMRELGLDSEEIFALAQAGKVEAVFRKLGKAGLTTAGAIRIFGEEAGVGAIIMTEQIAKTEALTEKFGDAAGTAEEMSRIQNEGLVGAIRNVISRIVEMQLALGDSGLTKYIQIAANWLGKFADWFRTSPRWLKNFISILLIAGPVLLGLVGTIGLLSVALGALGVTLNLAFGWWLIGILAVVAAAVSLVTYWDEIVAYFQSFNAELKDLIGFNFTDNPLVNSFKFFIGLLSDAWEILTNIGGWIASITGVSGLFDDWFGDPERGSALERSGGEEQGFWRRVISGGDKRLAGETPAPPSNSTANTNTDNSVQVGEIKVTTPATDGRSFAREMLEGLRSENLNAVDAFDSEVAA